MIVKEPPYDLVALFADLDTQALIEALLERGQEKHRRCTYPLRWRSIRDVRRDTVWREPERVLRPFLSSETRYLVMWDHQGSGAEMREPAEVEEEVVENMARAGFSREAVMAVALEPEIEIFFVAAWDRIKKILSEERKIQAPSDEEVLIAAQRSLPKKGTPASIEETLRKFPKEMFQALVFLADLRWAAPVYRRVGEAVSLPGIKGGEAAARIAEKLAFWFPVTEPANS